MTGAWDRHPEGPIITMASQLSEIPRFLLGAKTPFSGILDPQGRWRLTVRCEWTGTAAEFEDYARQNAEVAA